MRDRLAWCCALLVLAPGALADESGIPAAAVAFAQPIRGITLSTHLDGRDWAWDGTAPTLSRLSGLGATWVAIHPYASIDRDGTVRFEPVDPVHRPAWLDHPIREAHRQGLKILIKPHLAYWGSGFGWRGEIDFDQPAEWRRFWRSYRRWIVALAAATPDADGLVVGTELVHSLTHEDAWRSLLGEVRASTDVPLTYAANWDSFEHVGFWDALDAIGIQAYFPLVPTDQQVAEQDLRQGWQDWMTRLRAFSRKHSRPIIFTELGYNHAFHAAARPWDHHTDGDAARPLQEQCMRVALAAVENEPAVAGVFLWKWFPEPRPLGRNFQLATPGMIRVIRQAWEPKPGK